MAEIKTEGIIIRKSDLGEADRLLTILTATNGKIRAMAKGVRRPKAKLAAWLDMFRCNEMTLVSGRNFYIVTGAQTGAKLLPIELAWDRLATAYHLCELVDRIVEEGEDLQGLYVLLKDSLLALSDVAIDEGIVRASFEMKLMQLMGIAPELQRCVASGDELVPESMRFSPRLGGVALASNMQDDFAGAIDVDELKLMRLFSQYPCEAISKVRVDQSKLARAVTLTGDFLAYSLEARLKSLVVGQELGGV